MRASFCPRGGSSFYQYPIYLIFLFFIVEGAFLLLLVGIKSFWLPLRRGLIINFITSVICLSVNRINRRVKSASNSSEDRTEGEYQ